MPTIPSTGCKLMNIISVFVFVHGIRSSFCAMTTEKQCPSGFSWNPSSAQCIECSKGYIGPNCSLTCPYPWYGMRCSEGQCNCTRDRCDVARGCVEDSPTASTPVHFSQNLSSMDSSGMVLTLSTTIHHKNGMNGSGIKGFKFDATNQEITTEKSVVINFPTSILITVSGTSISILLLVAIGFQVRSRLFQGPAADERSIENEYCEIP